MSETEPSSRQNPSYSLRKRLNLDHARERTVSPRRMDFDRELRLCAWSVRWVLSVRPDTKPKRLMVEASILARATTTGKEGYVVYRRQMLALLRAPKPAFDQLALELPCLMGFRTREVATWRAEYIDWQEGDTQVLDAKKDRLFTVPLNNQAAKHAEEVLNTRSNGYVLQSRSNAWQHQDKPISDVAVWKIWNKWTRILSVGVATPISPVVGRRFFAAEWYYHQGLNLVTLQRILRHAHFETTVRYVQSLVFHEDVKRDYDRFQLGLMEKEASINA